MIEYKKKYPQKPFAPDLENNILLRKAA